MNSLNKPTYNKIGSLLIALTVLFVSVALSCCTTKTIQTSILSKQVIQDSILKVNLSNPADSNQISVLFNDAAGTKLNVNQGQLQVRVPDSIAINVQHGTVKVTVKHNNEVLSIVDLPYVTKSTKNAGKAHQQAFQAQIYDLGKKAPYANWYSGIMASDSSIAYISKLNWPGLLTDYIGYAREDSVVVEDGTKQMVLWTHPKWQENGCVYGQYKIHGLNGRKSFSAVLGFVKDLNTGTKSSDGVTFQARVYYSINGQNKVKLIFSQHKFQTGSLYHLQNVILPDEVPQDFDLSLIVFAGKESVSDWAAWIEPHVNTIRP